MGAIRYAILYLANSIDLCDNQLFTYFGEMNMDVLYGNNHCCENSNHMLDFKQ